MKKIHLIRHAKSCWSDPLLTDIERPLNERGINTACFMVSHIFSSGCSFKQVYCSPAIRAQSTLTLFNEALSKVNIQWQVDKDLYTFNSHDLMRWCRKLDDSIQEVVIVGHNPALTDFCHHLAQNYAVKNIPTCGYVQLVTRSENSWQDISHTVFEISHFLKPKKLKPNSEK